MGSKVILFGDNFDAAGAECKRRSIQESNFNTHIKVIVRSNGHSSV